MSSPSKPGRDTGLVRAALEVALDALAGAACVVNASGEVLYANRAAREELADVDSDLAADLRRALTRGGSARIELLQLRCANADCYLALRRGSVQQSDRAVQRAAQRWGLTSKQARVLRLLAEGHPNKIIAARLACAENTVEYHVSRLLAKAALESRSELIAELWRSA